MTAHLRTKEDAMRLRNTSPFIHAGILVSLLALSVRAGAAQNQPPRDHDPNAMDTTTTEASPPAPELTPEQIALIDRYLTPVRAQVAGKVDTKNAAPGQGITLEVLADAKLANGTELSKGSKLVGRIVRARAYEKDQSAALLSLSIDHAVLKDGKTVPVRCVIRTLTPAPGLKPAMPDISQRRSRGSMNSGSMGSGTVGGMPPVNMGGDFPMGGGSIGADSSGMGGMGGGGLGGGNSPGGANSRNGGTGNDSGYPNSTSTRNNIPSAGGSAPGIGGDPGIGGSSTTIGDRTRNALGTTTQIGSTDPEQPVATAGVEIHEAPRRTGLPGVMLSGASVAGTSGTFSAFESNITLDSSTQLTLGVISQ
jgi:hypothetical protein